MSVKTWFVTGGLLASALYLSAPTPDAPTPQNSDYDAAVAARAIVEAHDAALTFAFRNPTFVGQIPLTGTPSLATYLPPRWLLPPRMTLKVCIGQNNGTEKRAVATWPAATAPDSGRVTIALGYLSGHAPDMGQVKDATGMVYPPSGATAVSTFPIATCGPLPTLPFPAAVTATLP